MSPRQVYFVGSATTAIGLGYVSLAIGEVILQARRDVEDNHAAIK